MFVHDLESATGKKKQSEGGAAELGGETDAPHCQAIMEGSKEKRCPIRLAQDIDPSRPGTPGNLL